MKNLNKKVTLNKTKHLGSEKILGDLTNKVAQILEKGYEFLLGRMYFTGDNGYQNFLVFVPKLGSHILNNNKQVTNGTATQISSEKVKSFDTKFELTMFNVANGRVILKFNKSVLLQKCSSSLYSNFILNLYIVYELNNWSRNPPNNFTLKSIYLPQSN